MDVPLYYTLTYFGSGYSVLSFAWRVSQVFQAVFSALFSSLHVSASLQPLAGFPSASRPVQFAPTWWDIDGIVLLDHRSLVQWLLDQRSLVHW